MDIPTPIQPDSAQVPPPAELARSRAVKKSIVFVVIVSVLTMSVVSSTSNRMLWEKLLTQAVMPCSIVFAALLIASAFIRINRFAGWTMVAVCCTYNLFGNVWIGSWLLSTLEAPYKNLRPLDGPRYDVLVVLGGGTNTGAHGVAQLGTSSGDRVMLAARLYHRGLAGKIVCTGTLLSGPSALRNVSPGEEARSILMDVSIPTSALQSGEGRNTFEEIQYLKQELPKFGENPRIGLLTSAWHLDRAMRLALDADLHVEPVPSDFGSVRYPYHLIYGLPNPDGFRMVQCALKEYLAKIVGR
ncbi:MAG: YdcF family protein [Planctomycetota bacterium]|nr:YdcF family protein [Planctomycetota bacterium]